MLRRINSIGDYENLELVVNFRYLRKEYGYRDEVEKAEKIIGVVILFLAVFSIIAGFLYGFLTGNYNLLEEIFLLDSVVILLFWIAVGLIAYANFLLRDRDVFLDSLNHYKLYNLREKLTKKGNVVNTVEIDISEYFDHDLINLVDNLLASQHKNFIAELLVGLNKLSLVRIAEYRMGLDLQKLDKLLSELNQYIYQLNESALADLLRRSFIVAYDNEFEFVDELAIFIALCEKEINPLLLKLEIFPSIVESMKSWAANFNKKKRYLKLIKQKSVLKPTSTVNRAYTSVFSPTLVEFSRDFTAEIIQGDFILTYAHSEELQKLIDSVAAGESSATIILGEPGVGKTTLLKHLAVKMVIEDVPEVLQDKRLVGFDFNKAYALSASEQEFKASVEKVLEEVVRAKNIILVIDDLDELTNLKRELASEVVNIINDITDRYKLKLIATASYEGFSRNIKPYKSLSVLFNKINLSEPSDELAVQILFDSLPEYEQKYKIKITFAAVSEAVRVSHKFSFDKVLPDKALDLLEEAIATAQSFGFTEVNSDVVDRLVADKVGVNIGTISKNESELLVNLENELHKRIIGQHAAVTAVAAALRRARAGLGNKKRPVASFLFFGPTGVGKTELAKSVADLYFGGEDKMIRVDMSEYQEEQNLKRLIGYEHEGEFSGGYLTEAVRQHPFSLVLLDEIEKANPKVLDLFLQILDEGSVQDGYGRKVVFTNTIIIATSNVASERIADLISVGNRYKTVQEKVLPELRKYLRVEFLNRFDKIVMFKPLMKLEVEQIAVLLLNQEIVKLKEKGISLHYSPELVRRLVEIGYNPVYGARELRRVITDEVENVLAELIISGKLKAGGKIYLQDLDNYQILR